MAFFLWKMLGNQGNGIVLSDGTYISVWQRLSNESRDGHFSASLATVTSTDGGRSLGAPAPFGCFRSLLFVTRQQLLPAKAFAPDLELSRIGVATFLGNLLLTQSLL
jgi:hypothetical protein